MGSPITVFRSADENAGDEAAEIVEVLQQNGISATLLDDSAPEVPSGAYEVRVDGEYRARAEELIAKVLAEEESGEQVDASDELDLVTVYRGEGTDAEMEALTLESVLEDGGLSPVVIGDSRYPSFPWEVRVAREQEERARELIREALAAGPAAAEEAEQSTE